MLKRYFGCIKCRILVLYHRGSCPACNGPLVTIIPKKRLRVHPGEVKRW